VALTRSQLLAGDGSQGVVLSGQVQGVKQGVGLTILPDGTINFDSATATGVMRLNNGGAYNSYQWPTLGSAPSSGTILQSTGSGGLTWTSNFVATLGSTSAAIIPAGADGLRPTSPASGYFRLNSTSSKMEFYNGSSWQQIASQSSVPTVIGTVTSVNGSGGSTGLTFSGGPVTSSGTLTLGGTLALGSGGTGATTQAGAANAVLPSQSGQTGKVLATDGTNVSWTAVAGGSVTSVNASGGTTGLNFSGGPITTAGTLTLSGVLGIANGGTGQTSLSALQTSIYPSQTGQAGNYLTTNGTTTSWAPVTTGTVTSVTASGGTTGLTFSGSPITTAGTITLGGVLGVANGGTGQTTANASLNALLPTQTGNATKFFTTNGTTTSWSALRTPQVTATGVTAVANNYVVVTAAGQTVTLPASPYTGAVVTVVVAGTFLDTVVARNGSNIMGLAEDLTLDIANAALQFTYTGNATQGWRVN
jgi:hypothetical protein